MKIAILDTYYPDFLKSLPFDPNSTYEVELRKVLDWKFGTSDFVTNGLRSHGWQCADVVANHAALQQMWAMEHGSSLDAESIALHQIKAFDPSVIFLQDFSFFRYETLRMLKERYLICGHISCPFPREANVRMASVIWSSFPHYVKRFEDLGVRGIYMPLAFEPSVLEGPQPERDIDISFVGGVGRNSHWESGTDVLEAVAAAFPTRFQWWGYGLDNLPASSPLRACYKGSAWGRQMYEIYRRSKIVVNRHGEVAQGYTNNLRCFEATGCGARLVTEASVNLQELFPGITASQYGDPVELRETIELLLGNDRACKAFATQGQVHTLNHHTYAQRMKVVSETLIGTLFPSYNSPTHPDTVPTA